MQSIQLQLCFARPVIVLADWDAIWPKLVGIGSLLALIGIPFFVVRSFRGTGRRYPKAIVAHALASDDAAVGPKVHIVFHTYHGFLVYFIQTKFAVMLSPKTADQLLRRLHRHNLTWGLLCPGAVFIPILSWFEFRAQRRSISEQLQHISPVTGKRSSDS